MNIQEGYYHEPTDIFDDEYYNDLVNMENQNEIQSYSEDVENTENITSNNTIQPIPNAKIKEGKSNDSNRREYDTIDNNGAEPRSEQSGKSVRSTQRKYAKQPGPEEEESSSEEESSDSSSSEESSSEESSSDESSSSSED
jgi:hypothetical protein